MCGQCITWNWRDREDKTYERLLCKNDIPSSEDHEFIEWEADENGIIKIPSAGFTENVPSDTHKWENINEVWMATYPETGTNLGTNITDAPMLSYKIKVAEEGNYYIWIKGEGPDGNGDSVNYGVDGERTATITFFERPWSNYTQYTNVRAAIYLTSGIHDLNIWMREDSVKIMIIVLTRDGDYTPKDEDFL
ncbi:MAG TPA: hypothetical protein ENL19_01840 [candidate division WOR-3 bacterium]|uniref:Gylcosyl hydrolase 115 C-terminal domain-containing protein n=1 Tax=candidate division WOR-3 bacterium TaxID=2052148 RepID=A0A7C5H8Y5_UNCW3|nr:hypothetical protein [candidate division WOR-3 bacterium]